MASLVRLFSDYAYLISVEQRVNIAVLSYDGHLTGIWKETDAFSRCEKSVVDNISKSGSC